jgi:hypothetical protein
MPTAEQVRDLTMDTIESARGRAEDLVSTSSQGLVKAVNRAAHEVREHAADVELPSVEVPAVEDLVSHATSHKVRTTLIVSALILAIVLLVRRAVSDSDEPAPDRVS